MELTAIEVSMVQQAVSEAIDKQLHEMSELQLALVGGGCGETIAY